MTPCASYISIVRYAHSLYTEWEIRRRFEDDAAALAAEPLRLDKNGVIGRMAKMIAAIRQDDAEVRDH